MVPNESYNTSCFKYQIPVFTELLVMMLVVRLGNAPSAAANRAASEACVQAHNEGTDLSRELIK